MPMEAGKGEEENSVRDREWKAYKIDYLGALEDILFFFLRSPETSFVTFIKLKMCPGQLIVKQGRFWGFKDT